jgi:hypothetical protein
MFFSILNPAHTCIARLASLASSLVELTPATLAAVARFPAETCLSQGALLEDRENFGQVPP